MPPLCFELDAEAEAAAAEDAPVADAARFVGEEVFAAPVDVRVEVDIDELDEDVDVEELEVIVVSPLATSEDKDEAEAAAALAADSTDGRYEPVTAV